MAGLLMCTGEVETPVGGVSVIEVTKEMGRCKKIKRKKEREGEMPRRRSKAALPLHA